MKKTAYKNSGQAGKRVALALMVSIGILLLGVLVMTSMVLSEKLPEEMIHSVAVVLVFAADHFAVRHIWQILYLYPLRWQKNRIFL